MQDLDINQALRDIVALIDHARERYPHFEQPRGQVDIERAEQATATIERFLALQESMELTVECGNCGEAMYEVESGSVGGVGSWTKYTCHDCKISVELSLEPSD